MSTSRREIVTAVFSMTSENLCEPRPILAPLGEILCEPRRLWRHGSRAPDIAYSKDETRK